MDQVAARISALIESSGLSKRQLAEKMNVSNVSLSQWARGKNRPSGEGLEALCKFFEVSPAWLLYGDGAEPSAQTIKIAPGLISIPYLSASADCGFRDGFQDAATSLITFVRVTMSFINAYCVGASASSLHIITAKGDSMAGTLNDGDAVIIDVSQRTITQDGLYAVTLGQHVLIKRVQITPKGLLLLSDNPAYQAIQVDEEDHINVVGRAYVGLQIRKLT